MTDKQTTMPHQKHTISLLLLVAVGLFEALAHLAGASDGEQFIYSGFAGANLTVDGTATVTPAGLLELTNGTLQLKGHAFHPAPLRFRGNDDGITEGEGRIRSFSASFVFGILSAYPDISAHGIVFLVAPTTDFSTALASQYLGLVNVTSNGDERNRIFAVELDTLQQDEFRDINDNHVGVDINGLVSLRSSDAGYYADDGGGGFKNLSLISHEAMRVWVDYTAGNNRVNVTLAPLGVAKPVKPLISAVYNLSSVITDTAYVGFSSATGSFNSRHYVLGWSFAMGDNVSAAPEIDVAKLPKLPRQGPKPRSKVLEIVLPIASAAFVFVLGAAAVLLVRRRRRYSELREDWETEFGPHRFPYKDLHSATEGFKNRNLLGAGGFGRVYRGVLPVSGLEIAVKRVSHNSSQGVKEFIAEVVSLGRLQHRNLVRLLGYCRRKGELLLVYEYMSNGSLDKYLYGKKKQPALSWSQRFKIIQDIASGLLYLHEECQKVVIHRDIKASNVLLDSEMNGRLGDFGLARLYDHGSDPKSTHVVGTIGYLAPELGRTSKATPLTDVFAFGTFILEVACGRRPIFQDRDQHVMLVDWVLAHWRRGSLVQAVDGNLGGEYNVGEACLVLELGLLCSHPFANARPSMRQVVEYLRKEMQLPEMMVPADMSFHMLALTQNDGFDSFVRSYPSSYKPSNNDSTTSGLLSEET